MTFERKVLDFFASRYGMEPADATEFGSLFPLWYVPQLKLYLHFIFSDKRLEALPEKALQHMSLHFFQHKKSIIQLWEDQFVSHEHQIFDRLISLTEGNTTVHARQCKIERITQDVYEEFLIRSHLMRHAKSRFKYGLYKNAELIAVLGISAGRWMTKEGNRRKSFEIIRFASKPLMTVVGGFTKLLKHAERELEVDEWMTYMDLDWAMQGIYQRFEFQTKGVRAPHAIFIHKENMTRCSVVEESELSDYFYTQNAGSLKLIKELEKV
jgi:hypothetical protein